MNNNKSSKEINEIEKQLKQLYKRLKSIGPIMRGSITIMGKKNKQPYFSVSIKGKTRLIYLGKKRADIAKEYVDNYILMIKTINEITLLNMTALKNIEL